jgi:hypothetical protein
MLWQRPNIGSRVNREVHARFWERAEVKLFRATRHFRPIQRGFTMSAYPPEADIGTAVVYEYTAFCNGPDEVKSPN